MAQKRLCLSSLLRYEGQRLGTREIKTSNMGIATDISRKDLRYKNIKKRGQGASLSNTPTQTKKGRKITINIDCTLDPRIK